MFPVQSFEGKVQFEQALSKWIVDKAKEVIADKGGFTVAVAGGSLIKTLSEALSSADLDGWTVFMLDERIVPSDHPDSNYGAWLKALPNLHYIPVDTSLSVEESAEHYSALLPASGLDMAVIGMGPDGHIASLFPGLFPASDSRSCIPVLDSPKPPAARVSLSISYLRKASQLVFAVSGREKKPAFDRICEGDTSLPACHLDLQERSTWFVNW